MFAIIDLGSNSFHLLIAEHDGERFQVVDRLSEKIQLADGLSRKGKLGFAVDVISGPREAELIYRGICDPLPPATGNRLIIDIGGGSTEIALGNNGDILFATSVPVGCVNWRDRYFAKRIQYNERGLRAKEAAYAELKAVRKTLLKKQWTEAYASSGSAKMLANISRANGWSDGDITTQSISRIESAIGDIKEPDDIKLSGLSQQRRDLIAPGVAIMATFMESLNIDAISYSRTALREGVLSELSNLRVDYKLK